MIEDIIYIKELFTIGKYMLLVDHTPSDWLGMKHHNKKIMEPINIILTDGISKSTEEALQKLYINFEKAGFKVHWGHTSGYKGFINGNYYYQLPSEYYHAISDEIWELTNNHGRFFGPYEKDNVFYFTGAMSREEGTVHHYVSFNQARDSISQNLDLKSDYKLSEFINLNNFILSDDITTGDHDGIAVMVTAVR